MKHGLWLICGALLVAAPVYAENAFITDRLSVPLFPAPDEIGPALKRLEAGSALEVLARQDRFARVRDRQGAEGWVEARYLSAEAPARAQLGKLQDDLTAARRDLAAAQAALKQAQDALEQETRKNKEIAKTLADAQAATAAAPPPVVAPPPPPPLPSPGDANGGLRFSLGWLLVSFAMLGVGFFAGVRWLRERIRRRSGGMYLRV